MSRIKIMPDGAHTATPKHVPKSAELINLEPRFRPPGGKPPLPMEKSYNRQGKESPSAIQKNRN
jgi:hypothetical protein